MIGCCAIWELAKRLCGILLLSQITVCLQRTK